MVQAIDVRCGLGRLFAYIGHCISIHSLSRILLLYNTYSDNAVEAMRGEGPQYRVPIYCHVLPRAASCIHPVADTRVSDATWSVGRRSEVSIPTRFSTSLIGTSAVDRCKPVMDRNKQQHVSREMRIICTISPNAIS